MIIYIPTHAIHVWYIYLHLDDFYGKWRQIYTIHGWFGLGILAHRTWEWFHGTYNAEVVKDTPIISREYDGMPRARYLVTI